ncbi:hypothetical protein ADIS_0329 [Lunatimonas lonarensis]|uniref:Arylsulfatase n=1 Tax=Lunatimonas lonarensis TaxID=1232681 RepID=R7ZYQ6_9BACT|nr:hypothetical protein ADIS_0329 [Lunatimonas lonarensis]
MQLYHLGEDPGEQENLIASEPNRANELKRELTELIKKGRSTPGPEVTNDGLPVWQQLEWIED